MCGIIKSKLLKSVKKHTGNMTHITLTECVFLLYAQIKMWSLIEYVNKITL